MVALSTHPNAAVTAVAPTLAPSPPGAPPHLPDGIDKATADHVLDLFLSGQGVTIADIADRVNAEDFAFPGGRGSTPAARTLTVSTVAAILESPYAQQLFTTIRRLAEQRARIVAAELRTEAIYITRRIAASSSSDETARRAANALLHFRTIAPRRPLTRQPAPPNHPRTHAATPTDEPRRPSRKNHRSPAAEASAKLASAAPDAPITANQPDPLNPRPQSASKSHPASDSAAPHSAPRPRPTKPGTTPPAQPSQPILAALTTNTRARDAPPSL